jgi:AcrR family transcriptional regulator
MQVNDLGSRRATFTNTARRTQIVDAAIETMAELGYAGSSFAKIAKRAGLSSTRLISYHFASKDDLTREVVHSILTTFAAFVGPRVLADTSPAARLTAFLEANVELMRSHRSLLVVLLDVQRNAPSAHGRSELRNVAESDLEKIAQLFRDGQRFGEFRQFDPRPMAVYILALRNGVIDRVAAEPDLDLDSYSRELTALVALATRKSDA